MKIGILADTKKESGQGHVMRCKALAEEFDKKKDWVRFIPDISKIGTIKFDWLVLDDYTLTLKDESNLMNHADQVLVLDDRPNQRHKATLIVKPTFRFALLRDEIQSRRKTAKVRTKIKKILVYYGETNTHEHTTMAIEAILKSDLKDCKINLAHTKKVISDLIVESDLCIGAGGLSAWERVYLGLPTLLTSINPTQDHIIDIFFNEKVGVNVNGDYNSILGWLNEFADYPEILKRMSKECFKLIDNKGAKRIASIMRDKTKEKNL